MTWVGMPVDIVERLERLGLSRDDRLLYVEGFLYAGQYLTDGAVTARLPRLSDHPDVDNAADRLVAAEVWQRLDDGGFTIVDYFTANLARDEIAKRKEDARLRQERSRRHKAGDHSLCIRGRYCPEGQSDAVTRDVTREETRESQDTYLPDLPDLPGKVREGKGSAGDDDGPGSPKGSPTPASPPASTSAPHIFADPQRLGHCCHCNLPARNASHHPGAPDSLRRLADIVTDLGPITPLRHVDSWGDSYWTATATHGRVTWQWETVEGDGDLPIECLEFTVPDADIPERTDEQWTTLCEEFDALAENRTPPLCWESEDDDGNTAWRLRRANYADTPSDVTSAMWIAQRYLQRILTDPVQP